ncbi:hypothetical protein AMECASPLE_013531 [Ameca splendens]|uniref:Secreted protein n=1 Tax=Ameca splendens TaxID=208324 RepID=A0ABV0YZM5_9TELE
MGHFAASLFDASLAVQVHCHALGGLELLMDCSVKCAKLGTLVLFFSLRLYSALEAFIFDSRQTGRRGKERGRHLAKVAGSGTSTWHAHFKDYSRYMRSSKNI